MPRRREPTPDRTDDEERAPLVRRQSRGSERLDCPPTGPLPASSPHAAPVVADLERGASSGEERVCRICFEGEDPAEVATNPLISPCLCSGGSRFIHRRCLQQWRESAKASGGGRLALAYFRCEVCHFEYKYSRIERAACIRHAAVVPTVFSLVMALGCWLLGYIPIVQACLASFDLHITGLPLMLVHGLDGMIMMGLVCFVLQVCLYRRVDTDGMCPTCCICPDCGAAGMCADCGAAGGADLGTTAAGCGEVCGPILLVGLLVAAVLGFLTVVPLALRWLYSEVDRLAGVTVHMVENVHEVARGLPSQGNKSPQPSSCPAASS